MSTPEPSPRASSVTHLRVVDARPLGFDVRVDLADGGHRAAWVPRSVVEDARLRLRANQDLVAFVTAPAEPRSELGLQVIALLAARPDLAASTWSHVRWSDDPHPELRSMEDDLTELPTERIVDGSGSLDPALYAFDDATVPEVGRALPEVARWGVLPIVAILAFALGAGLAACLGGLYGP